jgi:hypothetical protein
MATAVRDVRADDEVEPGGVTVGITQRDVSPEVWQALVQAAQPMTAESAKRKPAELVAPAFEAPGTWTIGVEVPSLANDRDWRVRNRVAQAHRRAVSRALGSRMPALSSYAEHLHAGEPLLVILTRLGGRRLDRHDNLPASLKYVTDGICLMLGVDDSDERLKVRHEQEPGGPVGVRIALRFFLGDE